MNQKDKDHWDQQYKEMRKFSKRQSILLFFMFLSIVTCAVGSFCGDLKISILCLLLCLVFLIIGAVLFGELQ